MERAAHLIFGPFKLDPAKKRLMRGEEEVELRPMAVAVLRVLAEHAGQVLTKEDLLKQVWAGTYVTKTALKVCIREIREALGDEVATPRYIETVGRQGYQFVGQTNGGGTHLAPESGGAGVEPIVGREREIETLQQWLAKARQGLRRIVFVSGEPGIGKSTVVDLFVSRLHSVGCAWLGRGRCLEQYGTSEAYLPVLEAFGRLCREPGRSRLVALLKQFAPTWLVQMPALLNDAELAGLQQKVQGTTRQRMLREMAEALEALTADTPLVLVFEDLHWSDYSTLELISYLAQRQERARLMVIGTYRPTDLTSGHPLKGITRELRAHGLCEELPLRLLTERDITAYLTERFPKITAPVELASLIHRHTDGNALFMVNVVNALASQGLIVEKNGRWELKLGVEEIHMPDTLRQIIEHRLERLRSKERYLLEAASIVGREFTAAAVAAALGKEAVQVEELCAELVRRKQFVETRGTSEWPDGTVTARYGFIHALYQEVLYDRVTAGKRVQLHQRIGERLEQAYSDRRQEIAAELVVHFEQGRDSHRTIQYLWRAAENANQRCAYHEAISHLTKALELLKTLPDTSERTQQELMLQITLGVSLMAVKGYAALEVKKAYDRARELCQQVGETPQLVPVLRGLAAFYYVRAELQIARELGEQLLSLVRRQQDQALLLEAHQELGGTLSSLGEFAAALNHLEQGILLYDSQKHRSHTLLYGQDPGVSCLSRASHALWFLGYQHQALIKNHEALTLAQELAHPHSLVYALNFAAILRQLRGEGQACLEQARAALKLATDQGFPIWVSMGTILRGWALAHQGQTEEGIAQMHEGLASWQTIGAKISLPYFLALLAEAYGKKGQAGKGLRALSEALDLAHKTGDCWWAAELYRLKGQLVLQSGVWSSKSEVKTSLRQVSDKSKTSQDKSGVSDPRPLAPDPQSEAEACFLKAIEIARRQQAKSLELRAIMSLARLWQQQGKQHAARNMLSDIYHWFTEGFDTVDLQEAKALLEELQVGGITKSLSVQRISRTNGVHA